MSIKGLNSVANLLKFELIQALCLFSIPARMKKIQVLVIGRFQSIKTGVLLIFSFTTGDKIEFLPPMMFLNEYITGI